MNALLIRWTIPVLIGLSIYSVLVFVFAWATYHEIALILSILALHLYQYGYIKLELKRADHYFRVKTENSIYHNILSYLFLLIFIYLCFFYDGSNTWLKERASKMSLLSIVLSSWTLHGILANYYTGVRSFKAGLKFPGKYTPLTPWEKVHYIERDGNTVRFHLAAHKEIKVQCDERDLADLEDILLQWQDAHRSIRV